jgi:hypothetical protein
MHAPLHLVSRPYRSGRQGHSMHGTTTSKEFVIPVENAPGTLAEIATSLARADVNIVGLLCEGRGEFGILRLVTDKPEETEAMLRAARTAFVSNEVISVRVPNLPGELARIANKLAASGVNVKAAYTTAAANGVAVLTFSVDDLRSAHKILG